MERRHNTRHAAALAAAAAVTDYSCDNRGRSYVKNDKSKEKELPPSANLSIPFSAKTEIKKEDMYDNYKSWAMKTYGDSAKTKTVTRKKYSRIMKILKGEEHSNTENSKFRFWVKAKGFRIGPPPAQRSERGRSDHHLYVPCSKSSHGSWKEDPVYKKVAVVENFYNIIYEVHVDMETRGGKHAGQKRTYKTISETYAFLPREAVTHFLMSCADCQKRMHVTVSDGVKSGYQGNKECGASSGNTSPESIRGDNSATQSTTTDIDYNVPITTTYLKRMRSLGYTEQEALRFDREEIASNVGSESNENEGVGEPPTEEESNYPAVTTTSEVQDEKRNEELDEAPPRGKSRTSPTEILPDEGDLQQDLRPVTWPQEEPINMIKTINCSSFEQFQSSGSISEVRETSITSDGTKEEDDDEEEDDTDKMNTCDPDRLKAFNVFVRLFVDENLDRLVPISRQPKDKIQAIIDSCIRQFPEFSERARKRIRTYLKCCRRTKGTRDYKGGDRDRSTPHLLSQLAEHILTIACENEIQNVKRMRLGLKPISVSLTEVERTRGLPHPSSLTPHSGVDSSNTSRITPSAFRSPFVHPQESYLHAQLTKPARNSLPQADASVLGSETSQASITPTRITILNGGTRGAQPSSNSLVGDSLSREKQQLQRFTSDMPPSHSKNVHQVIASSGILTNGPTDLTIKKTSIARYTLNPNETSAIKQLIAGYRESAAFLLRSADELEQLLTQKN
ncbi:nucleolar protein 4-like isoform X2 [Tachypleus tridentatus]|uniref:nucleolar protein 4-like isoform X2 n=1 Tax=Tachypleus tridentatus TaxID=6853 RepID=UPI003FD41C6F